MKIHILIKLLTNHAKLKLVNSKLLNTPMFPKETATLYKLQLLHNLFQLVLMLKNGNSILEESWQLQTVELN